MSDETAMVKEMPRAPKVAPPPPPADPKFIFMGDPKDSGRGSRAKWDDDDTDTGTYCKLYGFKFPLGKAVSVPENIRIGETHMMVTAKLRGNSHFFEGDEAALDAAKKSGAVKFVRAPEKIPVLVKYKGMRLKRVPGSKAMEPAGEED